MKAHTMLVSFQRPLSATELNQFLTDLEQRMLDTGLAHTDARPRHLPEAATAALIVQFTPISTSALATVSDMPRLPETTPHTSTRLKELPR
ncbi:hypothetical protein F3087_18945 [Nocardia colli]|uniref:Uncharacterized protein n=1 Tax=Nocardia colli TaxID=2545717 RepID=A0A5N0EGL3_9NOCA|nr:hypothetical protein [Nocardia colli]KAA8887374.1 hypothetical protein F3087_18945 [Nocardia colli]